MVYRSFTPGRVAQTLLQATLPAGCPLCGAQTPADFCDPCRSNLPWLPPGCRRCAIPLPDAMESELCGQCLTGPPRFQRTEACWLYRPPLASLIADYKYRRRLSYGRILAHLLSERLVSTYNNTPLPDLVTAVPLHWWRQLRRGFNQSEALAGQLARDLYLPYRRLLKRTRATPPQQSLDARQRRRNLQRAFRCTTPLDGQCIALVDDVMTTGTTADEISRTLLAAGAGAVHIWCLARTPEGSL